MKKVKQISALVLLSLVLTSVIISRVQANLDRQLQPVIDEIRAEAEVEEPMETDTGIHPPREQAIVIHFIPDDEEAERFIAAAEAEREAIEKVYFEEGSGGPNPVPEVENLETTVYVEYAVETPAPVPTEEIFNDDPEAPRPEIVEEPEPLVIRPQVSKDMSADQAFAEVIAYATNEDGTPRFDLFESMGTRHITGYDCCKQCCGKDPSDPYYGYTASGRYVKQGRTCALNGYAFGTVVYIEGLGFRVVEDRGGMRNGGIDVYCDDHPSCYAVTGDYQVYLVWSPDAKA